MAQQHRGYGPGRSDDQRYRGRGNVGREEQEPDEQSDEQSFGRQDWDEPRQSWQRGSESRFGGSRVPNDPRDYGRSETGYGRPSRGQYRDRDNWQSGGYGGQQEESDYQRGYGDYQGGGYQGGRYQSGGQQGGFQRGSGYGGGDDYYSQPSRSYSGSEHGGQRGYGYEGLYFRPQQGQERQGGFRGRGPKGYQRSDERLKEVICECLTDDPQVDASNISITVSSGEVTLEGTVSDRDSKHRAEDLVDDISGVKTVHNRLRVESTSGRQGLQMGGAAERDSSGNGSSTRSSSRSGTQQGSQQGSQQNPSRNS